MKTIINHKRRPLIYATSITVGFAFLLSIIHNLPDSFYFTAAIILYLVLVFEIFSTRFYSRKLLDQFELPQVEAEQKLIQLIHHLFLPSITFFSLVVFFYFNRQYSLILVLLILSFFIFFILFTNIRAFYEDKFKLELLTHNIYDFLTLIIVFLASDSMILTFGLLETNLILETIINFFILLLLALLVTLRYKMFRPRIIRNLLLYLLIYSPVYFLLLNEGIASLLLSIVNSLIMYYYIAFSNHYQEGTVKRGVIAEYVIVFLIIISMILGLAR